ncbi:histidyl-tRNA synthetase [Smithella sp. SC_K08D17]|jgi:histidyl-tRNA synthetase|nr:histidyl-tRNA synthetase [Smithella sp. D17]KIE17276.1 histidyl-tRNA synthetase [Smithella sp. SC_K08D17]MDD5525193.1 histidine--tRNA ligase [Smithella sp.]
MEKITAIRGFKDILPQDSLLFWKVESIAHEVFNSFGYREIRVPIVEKTELFKRSIGETTDIVEKEMYTFADRDNEYITLRPEATASVIRAYIEHNMSSSEQITKLFTIGPMFRRERPQKGRFRQFNQIDVEFFGEEKPQSDAEIIFMLMHFLTRTGLRNLELEINSLGCPDCRPLFSKAVINFLKGSESNLCPDCQRRISTNPLRVFDCKVETCAATIANAPRILDFLCADCENHFSQVQSFLHDLNTPFIINARMVRGLDYYTKTAFEVKTNALGAQNAVAGGGRYNSLVSDLGGPEVPGIGFAVGFERLIACLPEEGSNKFRTDLFIAALGSKAQKTAFSLTNELRRAGVIAEMDYSDKSLKSQLKRADKLNSSFSLIFGDKEIDEKQVLLRNMQTKDQQAVPLDGMLDSIIKIIKER